MGLKKQPIIGNFDEIIIGCQMIFDEKMSFHSKCNLYCQTKAPSQNNLCRHSIGHLDFHDQGSQSKLQ